jgi:hypothetical protein
MDRLRTPTLEVAFRHNLLMCLDLTGKVLHCFQNHQREIRWIARLDGPNDTLCSYDGHWAIVWRDVNGHLELLNSFQLSLLDEFHWTQILPTVVQHPYPLGLNLYGNGRSGAVLGGPRGKPNRSSSSSRDRPLPPKSYSLPLAWRY